MHISFFAKVVHVYMRVFVKPGIGSEHPGTPPERRQDSPEYSGRTPWLAGPPPEHP